MCLSSSAQNMGDRTKIDLFVHVLTTTVVRTNTSYFFPLSYCSHFLKVGLMFHSCTYNAVSTPTDPSVASSTILDILTSRLYVIIHLFSLYCTNEVPLYAFLSRVSFYFLSPCLYTQNIALSELFPLSAYHSQNQEPAPWLR